MKNRINHRSMIIISALMVIVILIMIGVSRSSSYKPVLPSAVEQGNTYLEMLEAEDVGEVEEILTKRRQEKKEAEREERMNQLMNGTIDVWSLFTDYALMGDSRAVGFSLYDFLAEERVLAGAGWTIRDIETNLEDLVSINPSSIFLCFGLNDTSIGFWNTPQEYAQEYLRILQLVQSRLPAATIYVNSILPARDPAFAQSEKWYEIPDYSYAVGQMCEQNGFVFVNNDKIASDFSDLYDVDGIHLQIHFYPYWAANMMMAVYSEEQEDEDAGQL